MKTQESTSVPTNICNLILGIVCDKISGDYISKVCKNDQLVRCVDLPTKHFVITSSVITEAHKRGTRCENTVLFTRGQCLHLFT